MPEPVKPEATQAAEYALGLLRGDQRQAFERQLAADPALRAEVDSWQARLAPLDDAADEAVPPGTFEQILARIDDDGMTLPGTLTKRAAAAEWLAYADGITYRVLNVDDQLQRQTLLIRMQPGAIYRSHPHDIDEECLVIEGDLQFGDLVLRAGDFHLAHAGTVHQTGVSTAGCRLHVVVGMEL